MMRLLLVSSYCQQLGFDLLLYVWFKLISEFEINVEINAVKLVQRDPQMRVMLDLRNNFGKITFPLAFSFVTLQCFRFFIMTLITGGKSIQSSLTQ